MSCEHLVCAYCDGQVVEGRCQACRAARAEVHRPFGLRNHQFLLTLLLVLLASAMLLMVQVTG